MTFVLQPTPASIPRRRSVDGRETFPPTSSAAPSRKAFVGRLPTSLVAALPLAVIGCAHLATVSSWDAAVPRAIRAQGDAPGLPNRTELVAGQLVIHADFPLAEQHLVEHVEPALRHAHGTVLLRGLVGVAAAHVIDLLLDVLRR